MVALKECLIINGLETRQIPPTIRHLSIFYSWTTKEAELEEAMVRASLCLEGENLSTILLIDSNDLPSSISDLLKETKFLRAVSLILFSQVLPHNFSFQNFICLRYLRLVMPDLYTCNTLPREICRLYHLQVFDLKTGSLLELPNNFSDLVSLRHFIVEGDLHSKILGVGKLTSLQVLNHFGVQQKKGFEIEQLSSLKEIGGSLRISNLENVKSKIEASKARLAEKKNLDALYLQWNYGEQENENVLEGLKPNTNLKSLCIDGYGGVASPTWWEPSLKHLEFLTLEGCKAWELLPPIGELEFLKDLKLSGLAVREIGAQCYGTCQSMKFPSLEKLEITDMPDLEKWMWNDQLQQFLCFQKLTKLAIRDCPKLVDLPLSGCATSEVLERFPSLEILIIEDCPLIFQLPPLPYSSLLSFISIDRTGIVKFMRYKEEDQSLILDQSSSHKVGKLLAFRELSYLRVLMIFCISSLESLDLHSFVALKELFIEGCQSLTSLTFGEHLVSLKGLEIISCKTLSSMKGLTSWVNLERLHFRESPGFSAAWDSASKEIERTEPDFSLFLTTIEGDYLALLTLPICKQLSSLQILKLEFPAFTEEHQISLHVLTSIDLVNIKGCKNLQSFPFDLFFCLKELSIKFPRIQSLPASSRTEIIEECKKLRNIEQVEIFAHPVQIVLTPSTWMYFQ